MGFFLFFLNLAAEGQSRALQKSSLNFDVLLLVTQQMYPWMIGIEIILFYTSLCELSVSFECMFTGS